MRKGTTATREQIHKRKDVKKGKSRIKENKCTKETNCIKLKHTRKGRTWTKRNTRVYKGKQESVERETSADA